MEKTRKVFVRFERVKDGQFFQLWYYDPEESVEDSFGLDREEFDRVMRLDVSYFETCLIKAYDRYLEELDYLTICVSSYKIGGWDFDMSDRVREMCVMLEGLWHHCEKYQLILEQLRKKDEKTD